MITADKKSRLIETRDEMKLRISEIDTERETLVAGIAAMEQLLRNYGESEIQPAQTSIALESHSQNGESAPLGPTDTTHVILLLHPAKKWRENEVRKELVKYVESGKVDTRSHNFKGMAHSALKQLCARGDVKKTTLGKRHVIYQVTEKAKAKMLETLQAEHIT